jgi:23S rRNA (uracil1939-C5)-methyltransferase
MQPGRALDLFCGMGNFSLPLAMQGWEVIGMDMQRSTIRSGVRNAEAAGLGDRCRFSQESATKAARRLLAEKATFDCLLLDPPRSGCAELIPLLPGLAARRIIYISCDPATLARDLAGLTQAGYRLAEVRLVDMFPQTGHQETMCGWAGKGTGIRPGFDLVFF